MTFFYMFVLQCKRIARRKSAILSFLILPLIILLAGLYLPHEAADAVVTAGVYLPGGADGYAAFRQALDGHSGGRGMELRFVAAESPGQLADKVASGAWECGYVFPADFMQRLRDDEREKLITMVVSPASTLTPLISEAVSAALLDVCAADIALSYMEQSGMLSGLDHLYGALINELTREFFDSPISLKTEIEFVGGAGGGGDAVGAAEATEGAAAVGAAAGTATLLIPALLRGLTALSLFLTSCLCTLWYIEDRGSGYYRRLAPYLKPGAVYLPYFCAAAVFAAAEGLLALLLTARFFPGAGEPFPAEALALLLYLVYLAFISYFLANLLRRQEPVAAALPFLLIACLVFCPVLFDAGRFIPFAKWLAAPLPPTFYLRPLSAGSAAVYLCVGAVLCCAARLIRGRG